ncbi:hypothetical protein L0156_02230 [bacterium]|nr:hypothetical protein [bacterium]
MGLLYFELTGNVEFFRLRAMEHGFDLLMARTPYGIAGLGETHAITTLIEEMRAEPAMEFRFSLRNLSSQCLKELVDLHVPEDELRYYIVTSLDIKNRDLLVCEKSQGRYFVIRRPSKKECQNRSNAPILITREKTQYFAEFGTDFDIDQADFSRFAF